MDQSAIDGTLAAGAPGGPRVLAVPRRSLVWAGLAAVAAVVGALALARDGLRWAVGTVSGGSDVQGPWAIAVVVAWLLAIGVAVVAVAVVRAGQSAPARAATGFVLAAALMITSVAAAAGVVRLVRGLVDDTTVAAVTVSGWAWAAPVALASAVVTGARALGAWRAWAMVAELVVVLVLGMLIGAWPPGLFEGRLTSESSSAGFRPAHRPPGFGVEAVAPLGDAVYGVHATTVQAVDERGRWFPLGSLDDLRPEGYVGHLTRPSDDTIDPIDLVGLFEWDGHLVVATRRGGLFTAFGDRPGRMLAAEPTDRTPASLALLAGQGAVLLPDGALVEGAGPDGRGGLLVATTAGLVRIPVSGPLEPVAAADALLVGPPSGSGVRVVGRSDGSIVLVQRCAVDELAPGAAAFVEVVRWDGAACIGNGPAPVTVAADGRLVMAIEGGRSVTGAENIAKVGQRTVVAVSVDGKGRFIAAYDDGGVLLRTPSRSI